MRWRWAVIRAVVLGLGTLVSLSAGCGHERREREVKVIRTRPGREVRIEKQREERGERGRHKVEIKKEREKEHEE